MSECTKCKGNGIIYLVHMISNVEIKTAGPCTTCGANHGYHEYVKKKYSRNTKEACHIQDNLYAFPHEKRNAQIYKEASENFNILPVKCLDGDNVVSLAEHRKKLEAEPNEEEV